MRPTTTSRHLKSWLTFLVLGSLACGHPAPSPPEDLVAGAEVIHEMMTRRGLEKAGFFGAYPQARASDFVRFISSNAGADLWPPREGFPLTSGIAGFPPVGGNRLPGEIAYKRNRPDPDGGRQVVYRADDESGEVVVEAYADPKVDPVLVRRWKFPR